MMFAFCLLSCLLVIASTQESISKTQALDNIQPRLELKFQTELDNSTVIKQIEQQQIFKCQVRLAPAGSGALASARSRFKLSTRPIDSIGATSDDFEAANWPTDERLNISRLSIEWFRDDRPLVSDELDSIGVINVTLRGQTQQRTVGETANQFAKQAKTKRPRIEIKNTLNGAQLKLTSRLRVAHLKLSDGGQYKCIARATFKQHQASSSPALFQVDQWLESNATLLIVSSIADPAHQNQQWIDRARKKWTSTSDATTRPWQARVGADGPLNSAAMGLEEMKHGDMPVPTNQADGLADTSTSRGGNANGWSLFEDDEDLFRPDSGELINGQPPSLAGTANEENNDNTSNQDQMIEISDNGELSVSSSQQGARGVSASHEPQDGYLDWVLQQQQQQPEGLGIDGESTATVTLEPDNDGGSTDKSKPANTNDRHATRHHNQVSSFLHPQSSQKAPPAIGTKQHFAKLVHNIAPELSCYTGVGEFYHGGVSTAIDHRPCLNWLQVRLSLAANLRDKSANGTTTSANWDSIAMYAPRADNHNSCRNPNSDPRGPWCFVAYSEKLDGFLRESSKVAPRATQLLTSKLIKMTTRKQRLVWLGTKKQSFVVRPCAIGSCSEYLWLYVVAPPLGLLVLLTCLMSLIVRAVRKSHYNAIFSAAYQRHTNNGAPMRVHSPSLIARGLGKMFRSRTKRRCFASASKQHQKSNVGAKKSNYLDDDIFEIVDDIDWSEGQTPSMANSISSPKSNESFKLNAASFTTHHHQGKSSLTHSKSINPMLRSERPALTLNESDSPLPAPKAPPRLASSNMSKSKSQAGPMFATLRCHVRNTQLQQHKQERLVADTDNRFAQQKKSSSFIDNADLPSSNSDWLNPSITSNLPTPQDGDTLLSSGVKTGHLISCSSSTSSSGSPLAGDRQDNSTDKLTLVSELPKLESSSVNVTHEMQPLYEGKFSQVQWAYLRQEDCDATQATGRIGAQVAVHALKQQASLDQSVFAASNLRLRNLNHLNVIKVIGYVQYENSDSLRSTSCAIVYDMAHLMDLSDWLKEQSKEAVIAQKDEATGDLSLRQNLACLAKQIALAVDYLHDRQIVYKDLACRNCFIDVTRMLVKLASFNVEPEVDCPTNQSDSDYDVPQVAHNVSSDTRGPREPNEEFRRRLNLKSMVRPKYLLDYYVIDSRPSECQLLPLSWIPLESILFNKFNRQTDIWSYGCLLYELFSLGEVAYFGYSSQQVIDAVRSNLMPPQPLLCPNGIYKLMCKCLSDIPTMRPNIKHIYEQLNMYSGQCSSFLNHHLCII